MAEDLNTRIADRLVELAYALDDARLPLPTRIAYVKRELALAAQELLNAAGVEVLPPGVEPSPEGFGKVDLTGVKRGPVRTAGVAVPPVHDAVWEALQRLIENAASLGPSSQEDAMVVARWRGQFVAARERAPAPEQVAVMEQVTPSSTDWKWLKPYQPVPVGTKLYAVLPDGVAVVDESQERAEFEAWVRTQLGGPPTPDGAGGYAVHELRWAWMAWKAARGVPRPDHQTFSQQTPTGENDGKA